MKYQRNKIWHQSEKKKQHQRRKAQKRKKMLVA
jgi:hypothetical protein